MTEHTVTDPSTGCSFTTYQWSDGTPAVAVYATHGPKAPEVLVANGKFSVGDAEGNSYYDAEAIEPLIRALEAVRALLPKGKL